MKITRALAICVVAVLGLFGISSSVKLIQIYSSQKQIFEQTQKVASEVGNVNSIPNLEALRNHHQRLQDAIATLESIPNLPGLEYNQAQTNLEKLRPLASTVVQRLQPEEKAQADWESAIKLNADIGEMLKNPPYPAEIWHLAKEEWQRAISLLEKIPNTTYIFAQAQKDLEVIRSNHELAEAYLNVEIEVVKRIDSAMRSAERAVNITKNRPYALPTLLNAQTEWRTALNLLNSIPSTNSVSRDARELQSFYQPNFNAVNNAVEKLQQCLKKNASNPSFCDYEITAIDIKMPAYKVANTNVDESSEENSETEVAPNSLPEMIIIDRPVITTTHYHQYQAARTGSNRIAGTNHVRGYIRTSGSRVGSSSRSSSSGRVSGIGSFRAGGSGS